MMLNTSYYLLCVKFAFLLISDVVVIVVHLVFMFNLLQCYISSEPLLFFIEIQYIICPCRLLLICRPRTDRTSAPNMSAKRPEFSSGYSGKQVGYFLPM